MKKVFGIGISGLIGTRISELLSDTYQFDNLSIDTGVDITKRETLSVIEEDTEHDTILLLAAKADVDGCERDKALKEQGAAWQINVIGAGNVIEAARRKNKKIIYVSTDFVFNGDDTPDTGYSEESTPSPVNWYGQTKYEAEQLVKNSGLPYCIVRPAYPYRTPFPLKQDFVQVIIARLREKLPLAGVTDHIMTPTFVDDFALGLQALLMNDSIGIYHLVGSDSLTPYDAILCIGRVFGLDTSGVSKTTRDEFFKGRAARPSNLTLNNGRIEQLGVSMKTFEEGLFALKKQI